MRGVQKRAALRVIAEENVGVVHHMVRGTILVRAEALIEAIVTKSVKVERKVEEEGEEAEVEVNDGSGEGETALMIQNIP